MKVVFRKHYKHYIVIDAELYTSIPSHTRMLTPRNATKVLCFLKNTFTSSIVTVRDFVREINSIDCVPRDISYVEVKVKFKDVADEAFFQLSLLNEEIEI
jgi:hypothetical protein